MQNAFFQVFYRDKTFSFSPEPIAGTMNWPTGESEVTKLLQKVGNNKSLTLISPSPERHFRIFRSQFVEVMAAGGVVAKPTGEVLLIFRKGLWDLPKGHVEQGETIVEGAVREVREECGLDDLEVGREICRTYHFYENAAGPERGRWELKQTAWFAMTCPADAQPTPQREEDITRAEWFAPTAAIAAVRESYRTIIYVMERYFVGL